LILPAAEETAAMTMKIDRDRTRFREIVRGKIRANLRKYVTHGELIGRKGQDLVSVPLPQLDVPHFRYGHNGRGGVGQGDGDPGKPIARGDDEGQGTGEAGGDPGAHILEVDVSLDELAAILGDELELPRIEPKGRANISQDKARYTSVRRAGPESLRHFKRTYVQALKRQITEGVYDRLEPRVIPLKEDRRYRSWEAVPEPQANAAILYMMDVSGSMTDDQKLIVRTEAFWIDTWLRSQYNGVERRYIIHDAAAKEVDEDTFYHTRESGGTRISSAYKVCSDLIDKSFPPQDWNVYCFQFSDGDNWGEDNRQAIQLVRENLLPRCNLFCYGQVESTYGSGEFLKALENAFGKEHENLVLSEIENKDAIYDSIKKFLGKGK
jgi:sporulation protein YhbH